MRTAALMFEITGVAELSFLQVVRRHEVQLLRIAFRILGNWADAEDVAQEAFLRLNRHGLKFPNDSALGTWLYRVTVNLCIDKCRRIRPTEELPELYARNASAEDEMILEERKRMLTAALAALPAKERAAIVLREIEEFTTAEVAAILGSSEGTIRSQVSKALTKLRDLLTGETR